MGVTAFNNYAKWEKNIIYYLPPINSEARENFNYKFINSKQTLVRISGTLDTMLPLTTSKIKPSLFYFILFEIDLFLRKKSSKGDGKNLKRVCRIFFGISGTI